MGTMTDMFASVAGAGLHDGTSAANAWTMDEATSGVSAGDRVNVLAGTYIADDGASSSVMSITTGGARENRIEWRAYTTTIGDFTPGDTPPVVLQAATNTLTNAMSTTVTSMFNTLIGFRFTGASSHGVDIVTSDIAGFEGCRFDTNGGMGIVGDDGITLVFCELDNNTTRALDCDNSCFVYGSEIHNEAVSTSCLFLTRANLASTLFYDIGNGVIIQCSSRPNSVIGCTFDGDDQAAIIAIAAPGSGVDYQIWNNIFYDLFEGVSTGGASTEAGMTTFGFNYFSSCGSNYSDYPDAVTDIDDGTTDPFEDSAARDYRLAVGSAPIDAGGDAGLVNP